MKHWPGYHLLVLCLSAWGVSSRETHASQPDLRIEVTSDVETRGKRKKGNGIYNTTAERQKGIIISRRGFRAGSFWVRWENDTANAQGHDFSVFSGTRGRRGRKKFDIRYVDTVESRENITAEVLAGTYQTRDRDAPGPDLVSKPGDGYCITIRRKRGSKLRSTTVKLTATSDFSGKKDAVKARLIIK